ncbi:hypothetical protein LX32DRAFT_39757 [Colletotrichum zoysiae]|uniref:Uncharacterized protein n=1 Tax=Colletotrichum zoysiae TaxID=1216348 RepID=A0AAD9HCU0_9PEZI|nr:hypothetical protein LX32DRAFT_39757 [Colletotrichum zoysiae]
MRAVSSRKTQTLISTPVDPPHSALVMPLFLAISLVSRSGLIVSTLFCCLFYKSFDVWGSYM